MKKIHLKLKALEWLQHFSHNKSIGIFPNAPGQLTHKSLVTGQILLNFEPIPNIMSLLVAFKNEEDPIKNEGNRVVTTLFINSKDLQGELTPK